MGILFSEQSINGMKLKNRFILSAMHLGYAEDTAVSKREIEFYKARAKGGVSAVVIPVGIEPAGCFSYMHCITEKETVSGYKHLAKLLHEYDCKLILQLFYSSSQQPSSFTASQLTALIQAYKNAAVLCKENEIDAVEICCSSGISLLSQFLSSITNKRTDQYGGSAEKNNAFVLKVLQEIRKAVGEQYPVIVKVSSMQGIKEGYGISETIQLCKMIECQKSADAVTITGGWWEAEIPQYSYHVPEGGYSFLTDTIKQALSIPVIINHNSTTVQMAEMILKNGIGDFIGIGRAALAEEQFVNKLRDCVSFNVCQRCNKCMAMYLQSQPVTCAYNPQAGQEYLESSHRKVATAKKVLVAGGGPAGMLAAKQAAQRGFHVTLCTDEKELGGQLLTASIPPGKQQIKQFIQNLKYELEQLQVTILYETKVDAEFILALKPYFVVVAVGSTAVIPRIQGIGQKNVSFARDVFYLDTEKLKEIKKGKIVVIGGGSLGIEIAEYLIHKCFISENELEFFKQYSDTLFTQNYQPLDITIVEQSSEIGMELGSLKKESLHRLQNYQVKIKTNASVKGICENQVEVETKEGKTEFLTADHVIVALGSVPGDTSFTAKLEDEKISYSIIGDADSVGDAMMALQAAFDLFLRFYIA